MINSQGVNFTTTKYQTSIVKPVLPGQVSFSTGLANGLTNKERISAGDQSDLLKKIDEQLNKSRQMYPQPHVL